MSPLVTYLCLFLCIFWATVLASKTPAGAISAAVNTAYNLNVRNVETQNKPIKPQKIDIESNNIPLVLHFKSQSSRLKIMQSHRGNEGEMHKSLSEDEPDILLHEVRKPIIQHIRELIIPFRKTVQEVKPVVEHIETIVSQEKSNSAAPEPLYPLNVKTSGPAQTPNQSRVTANSPSFEDSSVPFPDEQFFRNRMNRNEPMAGAMTGRNGADLPPNTEGNSFNNWMHSFRNDDFANNNRNYNH